MVASITEDLLNELVGILSFFSSIGPSNAEKILLCKRDSTFVKIESPFVEDGFTTAVYWSFNTSTTPVKLNTGCFGTRDHEVINNMLSVYRDYSGDPATTPFSNEMNGLKLIWQLSLDPRAMLILRISDKLIDLATEIHTRTNHQKSTRICNFVTTYAQVHDTVLVAQPLGK
jgi:hypothetical protein